ncbi:wall-associated receptor kinase 2-like isoform X2 [Abrus precatorius]|uniref:Wall-associated receptor kinase 2-like isoform X2 n=1 Tax=Abrus precatorius TaxID=3816 RepID=A0A8B8MB00_ABRPR|nr:wall-associated receptor kinase 2-like isoform X2 [Abrus precatorius]
MAMHINLKLHKLYLMILVASKVASQPMLHCPQNCGNLNIPYPFGTSKGCYMDETFLITCNHSSTTPIPRLGPDNIMVLNISLDDGELLVSSPVVHDCDGAKGNHQSSIEEKGLNLTRFSISPSKNKFTALGCDTVGIFMGYDKNKNRATTLGCVAICSTLDEIMKNNGSCGGTGCCQISVPNGVYGFEMQTWSMNNHSPVRDSYPCNYAFCVGEGYYNFKTTNLENLETKSMPVVLDWAVGNQTCEEAQNIGSYACKDKNSVCLISTNGIGYRCKCNNGFQGNPYVHDINECNMKPNPCISSKKCQNFPGSFKCSCPKGQKGDGLRDGEGCRHINDKSIGNLILIIGLSLSLTLLAVVVGCINICPQIRERKLIKMRESYFQKNGGLLLQQQIDSHHGSSERATIFTVEELKKATNNYDEDRIIGKGGHGTVYKGTLSDGRVVAIKKSMVSNQSEIEQFINEVVVLSQINHRNVVKLVGCCLETQFPLLVYEFITNGTLFDHLHIEGQACYNNKLSWTTRLRIVAETAEALAYLHSAVSTPIIHRDVKTANILLDENLTAKVSDFGASKLVPLDQTQLTTLVQGTLGYLDPEYFQTSQLTEKSDVYSFGVVLAEVLTSKKALSFLRPEVQRNLSMYFVSSIDEDRLDQILDSDIVSDANVVYIIEVANLAKRCLRLKGQERPSMKEVAMELEGIRVMEKHSLGGANNVSKEETECFLKVGSPTTNFNVDCGVGSSSSSAFSRFYNMQNQILESLGAGR